MGLECLLLPEPLFKTTELGSVHFLVNFAKVDPDEFLFIYYANKID